MAVAIVGGVVAFECLFLAIGVGILVHQSRFRGRSLAATGTLVAVRRVHPRASCGSSGPVFLPTVRFVTAQGQVVEAEARSGTNLPQGRVGGPVNLRYDPADPRKFTTTRNARAAGCVAIGFTAIGGFAVLLTVSVLIAIALH